MQIPISCRHHPRIGNRVGLVLLCLLCLGIETPQLPAEINSRTAEVLWHDGGVLIFQAGMTIDADGAPHAYSPVPGEGLDTLENAGFPGHWDGIATRDGEPLIQGPDAPAPGYYVSTTALQDHAHPPLTQRRYVNAAAVPYIALPESIDGPQLGDVAMVVNIRNHRATPAIFADISPQPGEGSIALARKLAIDPDARSGGTGQGIVYVLFEQSGKGSLISNEEIQQQSLDRWSSFQLTSVWESLCSEHVDWDCERLSLDAESD